MNTATAPNVGPVVLATHSSRHTPVCTNCTHYFGQKELCNHPSTAIDVLTGRPVMSVYAMRAAHTNISTNDAPVRCGVAGKLFEAAVATEAAPAAPPARKPGAMLELAPGTVDPFSSPWALPSASPRGDGPHDYTVTGPEQC